MREGIESFDGGRLYRRRRDADQVPGRAALFVFLADAHFRDRESATAIEISLFATPFDGAFTKPNAAQASCRTSARREGIMVVTDFASSAVDAEAAILALLRRQAVAYDLLVRDPAQPRRRVHRDSGLGDALVFVPTDPEHAEEPEGKSTSSHSATTPTSPTSKAGSVAHFAGRDRRREPLARHRRPAAVARRSTATPTASSRPATARRCCSTSTTTSSRWPARYPLPGSARSACSKESRSTTRQARLPLAVLARAAARPGSSPADTCRCRGSTAPRCRPPAPASH